MKIYFNYLVMAVLVFLLILGLLQISVYSAIKLAEYTMF